MKNEQMVGTNLPEDLVQALQFIQDVEQSDRSTVVRRLLVGAIRRWRLEHYARMYGDGKLTLSRAACDAGASVWEMMEYLRERKISAQYDIEDLKHDYEAIVRRLQKPRCLDG